MKGAFLALSHLRSGTASDTFCSHICWSKMLWGIKQEPQVSLQDSLLTIITPYTYAHLVRTLPACGRPQLPVYDVRIRRFSRRISHRRCRTGVLARAAQSQTAAGLSWRSPAPADTVWWTGFRSFPGLNHVGVRKPPTSQRCAPPLGSGRR